MEVAKKSPILRVLMLPWLAHGHILPFLELAKRLATRNFRLYLCSTPVNLISIKKKISDKFSSSIQLVELHLPSSPELPPHHHTTNGLPPHLMAQLKKAYEMSAPQFSTVLSTLHPDLVIYDLNQPWAAKIASSHNIPAVQFISVSTSFVCFCLHTTKNSGKKFPYPEIYLRDYERLFKLQGKTEVQHNDVNGGSVFLQAVDRSHKSLLIKSFREIEGKFVDFLSSISNKKVIPVGPLVHDPTNSDEEDDDHQPSEDDREIMAWLDRKERNSVVYVSFGSEYYLTNEERKEIAKGLELSNVNFIWVIRFPLGEKISIEEALPEGFLHRIGHRGKIVERWAPQPLNARLVEAVGVGVEAIRDEEGNLQSEEIGRVIRQVMVDENGEDVRRKAKEISEKLERKGDEEIDTLVEELLGLCQKNLYIGTK
ncbi:OLC1v1026258C1 [Oldenlandia corymbosa var. corymbosa]|uniref:OLC1v1026258C1 n=1 Tax=Oldenlandia corymbosa var. corymbosa TaxID=529605 RepID=A0AAV1C7G7_OLDCO|nr:OLC1v1026258C1 [Oldenlandia corymbosa var. corymbosa]